MDFALFRLPHSADIHLWIGQVDSYPTPIQFNKEKKFILGKFNTADSVFNLIPTTELKNEEIDYSILSFHLSQADNQSINKLNYCSLVQQAVNLMEVNSSLKKVVLTRSQLFEEKINPIDSFKNLCNAYPNAFIHLSSTKSTGTWLGASPEQFISLQKNELKTVALAGTFHAKNGELNWTQKELKEQNWVEIHIEDVLKQLQIPFTKNGPQTMRIGELFHLISTFISPPGFPINLNELIKELNPTPAVGGIPKKESIQFIDEFENMKRDLYTGIIGPYFSNQAIELFVNLRCLQIHNNGYTQYAGAGITAESLPEKEWYETENKIAMTKNLLKS